MGRLKGPSVHFRDAGVVTTNGRLPNSDAVTGETGSTATTKSSSGGRRRTHDDGVPITPLRRGRYALRIYESSVFLPLRIRRFVIRGGIAQQHAGEEAADEREDGNGDDHGIQCRTASTAAAHSR